jgi:hypothetical protein
LNVHASFDVFVIPIWKLGSAPTSKLFASTIGVTAIFFGSQGAATTDAAAVGMAVAEAVATGVEIGTEVDVLVDVLVVAGFFAPLTAFATFTHTTATMMTLRSSTRARRRR